MGECQLIDNLCIVDDYMYAVSSKIYQVPQRYSFSKCLWQTFNKVAAPNHYQIYCSGATVLCSKVYVLCGSNQFPDRFFYMQNAGLHCFDPVKNKWKKKQKPVNLTLVQVFL